MDVLTNNKQTVKPNNPKKFLLWVAIASIVMAFAGLTSAYLVKKENSNWLEFSIPSVFWISTAVIVLSSIVMHFAVKAFKSRAINQYRILITITGILGLAFCVLQFIGYQTLEQTGISILGSGSNPSASFLGVISGFHILHVLGGIIALIAVVIKSYNSKVKTYDSTLVENTATYWHFVDILWIYLFIFLNLA